MFLRFSLCHMFITASYYNCHVNREKNRLHKSAPSIMLNAYWAPFPRLLEQCSCCGDWSVASFGHEGAVHVHSNRKLNLFQIMSSDILCVVLFLRGVFMVLTSVGQDCFLTTCTLNKLCSYCLIFKQGKKQVWYCCRADSLCGRKINDMAYPFYN